LTLAYASTVHKSQGSEFPLVFMPLTSQHYIMLQRNLLYTGMTRAKKRLVLVADKKSIKRAVENDVIKKRFSMLADRIKR
jgi:exodeoxyribonuclease V alpha subunit